MVAKTFLIALLSLTGLIPTDLPAQDSGCTQRTVAVGVVDRQWNLVQGLGAANFRGKLRGRDVQILSVAVDTNPRRIVVLLDASGSMMGSRDLWGAEKSFSEFLIRFGPPRAFIALMAFSATVLDSETFEQDPMTLMTNLHKLVNVCEQRRTQGQTALFDAISTARVLLGAAKVGDVIYALTDAVDNKSRTEPKKLQEELLGSGVRVFGAMMSPDDGNRTPLSESPSQFRSMASATGGNMLTLPSGGSSLVKAVAWYGALDHTLRRFYQQMGEFYRLDVRLPETLDKPTKWKLEVIDAGGRPMRGVEIHYPQELMPCGNVGGRPAALGRNPSPVTRPLVRTPARGTLIVLRSAEGARALISWRNPCRDLDR